MNALTPFGTPLGTQVGTADIRLREPLSRVDAPAGPLELRELRYFAAAARAGNLGRAAQALDVTASAISQQLRKLEDTLGTQLLIRHGRGVTPTPAGARLLERIDTILHLLNAPLDSDQAATRVGETVTLAIPAEIGSLLVAPLVAEARHRGRVSHSTSRNVASASKPDCRPAGGHRRGAGRGRTGRTPDRATADRGALPGYGAGQQAAGSALPLRCGTSPRCR